MSRGFMPAIASGSSASSCVARRVIEPVCQCSSRRPVVSTIGKASSGSSCGDRSAAGTILARPDLVGKDCEKMISLPGLSGASHG